LRAWIAMFEGACLDWISHQELDRTELRELLIAGHAAMLTKAAEMDPKSGPQPGVPAAPGPRLQGLDRALAAS
jgi:hypothetical protein